MGKIDFNIVAQRTAQRNLNEDSISSLGLD